MVKSTGECTGVRDIPQAELIKELDALRSQERKLRRARKPTQHLMARITELALEDGRRERVALGETWPGDL